MRAEPIEAALKKAGTDLEFLTFTIKGVFAFNLTLLNDEGDSSTEAPLFTFQVSTVQAFRDNQVCQGDQFTLTDPQKFRRYTFKVQSFYDDMTGWSVLSVAYLRRDNV